MSDKELVLSVIQQLPARATLGQIRSRIDFLAALKEAEESLDRGDGVSHEEVKRQFASWVKSWRAKSSGRRKHSKISAS
jgi:aminoglycoside phosphotransferase (APT) family kinase protein